MRKKRTDFPKGNCIICGKEFINKSGVQICCKNSSCKDKWQYQRYKDRIAKGLLPKRKRVQSKKEKELCSSVRVKLYCKCPTCDRLHEKLFEYGFTGNGIPRVRCYNCQRNYEAMSNMTDEAMI